MPLWEWTDQKAGDRVFDIWQGRGRGFQDGLLLRRPSESTHGMAGREKPWDPSNVGQSSEPPPTISVTSDK